VLFCRILNYQFLCLTLFFISFFSIAASTVRFSIVATSSQSPVLILAGIPQSHYVESGVNEYFKFYPHADEDLHITLTARSGDPDMFVSTEYMKPHCTKSTDPYSS